MLRVRLGCAVSLFGTTRFAAWPLALGTKTFDALVVSGSFTHKLFYQADWPRPNGGGGGALGGDDGGMQLGLGDVTMQPTSELKYTFEIVDGYHCVQHVAGKGNNSGECVRWIRLANFAITQRLPPLQFIDVHDVT